MRITIEKLVYGGSGFARTPDGVVFVPRTAPGDTVEAEIVERRKDYSVGRVIDIITPSPMRQVPVCPNYETAGCCHWQHIAYANQVDIKEQIVRESLKRLGGIDWPSAIPRLTGPDLEYRRRATFHAVDGRLGFMKEQSRTVVPIERCAALAPPLNAFLAEFGSHPDIRWIESVAVLAGDDQVAVRWRARSDASNRIDVMSRTARLARISAGGFDFEVAADSFTQANRFLQADIVKTVVDQVGPVSGTTVVDLFCGAGFYSIPLSRQAPAVVGVDSSASSIRSALKSAEHAGAANITFVEASVDAYLRHAVPPESVFVLNPPRTGAGRNAIDLIAAKKPRRAVYVSCNPSTLAPEAKVLMKSGYSLTSLTLIDQFPHTYHIETVATFDIR